MTPVDYDDRFSDYTGKGVLPCPPFGDAIVRYHTEDSWMSWFGRTHRRIMRDWDDYWPKIHRAVVEQMAAYECEDIFGKWPFEVHVSKSGGWIKDDVMFELLFTSGDDNDDTGPFWVVAFKGGDVIHAQASF